MAHKIPFQSILFILLLTCMSGCTNVQEEQYKPILESPQDAHPAPIAFSKMKVQILAGEDIGAFREGSCLWPQPASRSLITRSISQQDLGDLMEVALEGQGYDVVDRLSVFFDDEIEDEILRTEYKIGAKVIRAEIDSCHASRWALLDSPLTANGIRGELFLTIEWSVQDALRRYTVYKTTTNGYAKNRFEHPDGLTLLINDAFEMAAHNLGTDQEFHDLIFNGVRPDGWKKTDKNEGRPRQFDPREEVFINNQPLSTIPFTRHVEQSRNAAVMVQAGAGHGSGFFISQEGHILTNQHVVGNALNVQITTKGKKKKIMAEVLRRNRSRDVALLKLTEIPENLEITTLPIRTEWPAISEDVYAIGAPVHKKLQDTVSKGIISAHRKNFPIFGTKVNLLQADVSINGGNSGGPLVDANGNIVGLTVAGYDFGGGDAGLNLFIPIEEALEKMDIILE